MVLSNSPRLNNFSLYFLSEKWKEANFNHWIFPNKPSYNLPVWSLQFKPQLQKATLSQSCQPPTPSSPGPSQTQEQYEANKHPRLALLPLQTKISLLLTARVNVPEREEGGRSRNKKAAKAEGGKAEFSQIFLRLIYTKWRTWPGGGLGEKWTEDGGKWPWRWDSVDDVDFWFVFFNVAHINVW